MKNCFYIDHNGHRSVSDQLYEEKVLQKQLSVEFHTKPVFMGGREIDSMRLMVAWWYTKNTESYSTESYSILTYTDDQWSLTIIK